MSSSAEREAEVQANLARVQASIPAGAGVRLVAVSKTKPPADILAAYAAGQRHFGENYIAELVEKAAVLPADICWHFIGTLQSNKCKALTAIPSLWAVESVDSIKKALALHKAYAAHPPAAAAAPPPLRIFLQLNTSGEASKGGIEPDACLDTYCAIRAQCPGLHVQGLMTIGSAAHSAATAAGSGPNPDFTCLREARERIHAAHPEAVAGGGLELSMGMSEDYVEAIAQGATSVRVGSRIFGSRARTAAEGAAEGPSPPASVGTASSS